MYLFESKYLLGNEKCECLIIFSGQLEGSSEEYGYLFEEELRNDKPRPQIVFFLYPDYLNQAIDEISELDSAFYDNLVRFGEDVPIVLCSFDGFGKLSLTRTIFIEDNRIKLNRFEETIVRDGILHLAQKRKDSVILESPPGTVFVKPSKRRLDEFIQASGLAVGYSENQFVAFSLLNRRPTNTSIRNIYIDTSGISSYIEALTYYLYRFSNGICKPVKYFSFNSYFGLDTCKPDDISDIWVIISASNSNSLGKKILTEWSILDEQIVTIISYSHKAIDGEGDTIVCNISSISDGYKNPEKFVPTTGVKVIGENFTAQVCEPNQVILKRIHKTLEIGKCVNPFNNSHIFKCLKSTSIGSSVKPIYIDMLNILKNNEKIENWLRNVVRWYVPSTLNWIIYNDQNEASKKLYKLVCQYLPKNINVTCVSFSEADTNCTGDGTVLVLEPVISSGKSLLRLNRNLRISGHRGNRIFICPYVTAASKADFTNFKKSLIFGPKGFKYAFYSCYELFIGHSEDLTSWALERRVVENFQSDFWRHREQTLSLEGEGILGEIGLSNFEGNEKLSFTQDFAFWNSEYDCEQINPESVYATIASILQGLRETTFRDGSNDSLYSNIYQHSVIDPENFTRFNDGLIQTCLWRSANASEVDYKSSEELSNAFADILLRLMDDMGDSTNNSALDLLMGVAVGKIVLTKSVLSKLESNGRQKLSNIEYAVELFDYIKKEFLD